MSNKCRWWENLTVGDLVRFNWNEFDGKGSVLGEVKQVESDHVIVVTDGMNLWLDDNNEEMFILENRA